MLPELRSIDDYRKVFGKAETWDKAMKVICECHNLPFPEFRIQAEGSHVVYVRDGHEVVKLYCPLFESDHAIERAVMERVHGRIGVATPAILYEGDLEGWPYVVTSFVVGTPIGKVWPELDQSSKIDLARQIGELMAQWHALPIDDLDALDVDWPKFIQTQLNVSIIAQRGRGLSDAWLSRLERFAAKVDIAEYLPDALVLLNGDFTEEHFLVKQLSGGWRISGLIDFGDAMLGHFEYDFVAPTIGVMPAEGECQRAMFRGYGLADEDIGDILRDRLMVWSLLHRFADVPYMLERVAPTSSPKTVDGLALSVWNF